MKGAGVVESKGPTVHLVYPVEAIILSEHRLSSSSFVTIKLAFLRFLMGMQSSLLHTKR